MIQSSSASVGILQALCVTGAVSYSTALPIIMGQNIGTCVTALISGIGASKNARRASLVHLYFNLIGTVVFMIVFYALNAAIGFPFMTEAANGAGIAVIHTVFNVCATLILLPFSGLLEKLACLTIKDDVVEVVETQADKDFKLLDVRFLDTPGLAVEQCREVSRNMAELSKEAFFISMGLVSEYNEERAERVKFLENEIDRYEDTLGSYLVKLGQKQMSERDNHTVSIILQCLTEFERISDHAVTIMMSAKEMHDKGLEFSKKAVEELAIYTEAVKENINIAVEAFKKEDTQQAIEVETLKAVISKLKGELKQRHIKRLQKGKCTIELGFIHADIITSYKRVADHCSNVAVCITEVMEDEYETHGYTDDLKHVNNEQYKKNYRALRDKYLLP